MVNLKTQLIRLDKIKMRFRLKILKAKNQQPPMKKQKLTAVVTKLKIPKKKVLNLTVKRKAMIM